MFNRIANSTNPYQGNSKKVLCVCSAGLLRSPTLAWMLSNDPYNFNTRAAGVNADFALIPMDEVLISWADLIVFVEPQVERLAKMWFTDQLKNKTIYTLNLPDKFPFKHPELLQLAKKQFDDAVMINSHVS